MPPDDLTVDRIEHALRLQAADLSTHATFTKGVFLGGVLCGMAARRCGDPATPARIAGNGEGAMVGDLHVFAPDLDQVSMRRVRIICAAGDE